VTTTSLIDSDRAAPPAGMEVYEDLRLRAQAAIDGGRFEEALQLDDAAWKSIRGRGDQVFEDRAFLNRSASLISLGRGEEALAQIREILVRNLDPVNCRLAAYNVARIYEYRKENKKGLFYARIAKSWLDNSESPDPNRIAAVRNQIGNFLLAESKFDEAIAEYRAALEIAPDASELRKALTWSNLGYCLLVQKSYSEGFRLKYRALRVLRRHGAEHDQMIAHLDLAFGHLEIGRYGIAQRHAARALKLAENDGYADALKNALYLSGEAANLQGDVDEARMHFERLQRYFPETPFVTDFLLAIDVRKVINLRA
jgi:tetratricopeptide (TPR) repeat protein